LTPSYVGLGRALDLPQAATLCGECDSVCPVGIPISGLLRKLREKQVERRLRPWRERAALAAWGFFARRPALYALATKLAARALERAGGTAGGVAGTLGRLPLARGWTDTRDIPAPAGRTFRELYAASRTHLDPSSKR
ncbi:lactate utilisation protein LutB domain-containing protein, partial [Burkholderia pseudomallei]|uniref:lactate utilisation protein LutB domain-containing protein n=1 Tax=Burkholderia pseudomallei TaxID=28450 RepID=UPI0021F6BC2F